jgi:hypothetical protein
MRDRRVVAEVRRRVGLVSGDDMEELGPAHRLQGVVVGALPADRRDRLGAELRPQSVPAPCAGYLSVVSESVRSLSRSES